MNIKFKKTSYSFTLMELLIVVALLALIVVILFLLFNPKKQIEKSWDSKKISELKTLEKVFEDWYNDKNCYPKPSEVCYDNLSSNYTCHICGRESRSPNISPYLPRLPCDSQHPTKDYLYQVDNPNCPRWYRIYADLNSTDISFTEAASQAVGCYYGGCGPAPNYGYDFGVSSPNQKLEYTPSYAFCSKKGHCNTCFDGKDVLACLSRDIKNFCQEKKRVYPGYQACIQKCPCRPIKL